MRELCRHLVNEGTELVGVLGVGRDAIVEKSPDTCVIIGKDFDVEFQINEMTLEITSSITIKRHLAPEQEYFDTAMIATFFPDMRTQPTSGALRAGDSKVPIQACAKIVERMNEFSEADFRDLHFFLKGFAIGYTDASA